MAYPSSHYLRALIAAIHSDSSVPREIRNECHRLMQAIDANDPDSITISVDRIERFAKEASFKLPRELPNEE
ncbi:MAG TPA: hypothetical protein VGX46_13820 [Vicinamibacterales bacterium]|jgi:uncharacterized protein (UPF0147 family)|nr:hypothetical protein [Vicinamibacterales bacterium]